MRIYTLTGTKDVSCGKGCACIRSNLCFILNDDGTDSAASRCIRYSRRQNIISWCSRLCFARNRMIVDTFNPIPACRSHLSTTIDVFLHLGHTLNGDSTVAAYQCREAMRIVARTSTEYAAIDNGCVISCCYVFLANYHLSVPFYAANLTTAIDVASAIYEISIIEGSHRSASDGDFRSFIFIIICSGILACTSVHNAHHGFVTQVIIV